MNCSYYKDFDDWWQDYVSDNFVVFDDISEEQFDSMKEIAQDAWKAAKTALDDDGK